MRLLDNFENRYPADYQTEMAEKLGNTHTIRLFWGDLIITAEPENIKR